MMSSLVEGSYPYGGLSNPYKFNSDNPVLVPKIKSGRPGVAAFPEKRTVDAPQIKTSSTTDRKKSNAQICYTRVTKKHHQLRAGVPGGAVFVSRTFSEYDGTGMARRSVVFGLDAVNAELRQYAKLYTKDAKSPLDDWRSVKALREWTLDGIVLGLHKELVEDNVLNICVSGNCLATNVFDYEHVFPLDTCFLCLVAEQRDFKQPSEHFRFEYVPCTSTSFSDPKISGTVLSRSASRLSTDILRRMVGAWKLGRVVDTAAVKTTGQHSLTLSVNVEWVGWRALRDEFQDAGIGSGWLAFEEAPLFKPAVLFNWPSKVHEGGLEPPSIPERSEYEIKMDKRIAKELKERSVSMVTAISSSSTPEVVGWPNRGIKRTIESQSPPTSPVSKYVKERALEEAGVIIKETNKDVDYIIKYLKEKKVASLSDLEDESWFAPLKKAVYTFKMRYAKVVYKNEQGAN